MKKYFLLVWLLLCTVVAYADGQLGLKLAPSISFSRVHTNPNNAGFDSMWPSLRFKIGAIYDHLIRDNYYVSTGLLYEAHQASIENEKLWPKVRESYEIGYLQAPLLLKLYTSEITLDTRIYAELGGALQVRINNRNVDIHEDQGKPFIESFSRWGFSFLIGGGVEYDTSLSTSVFGGISYQCSLASIIAKHNQNLYASEVMGYCDLLSLDLGVRF